MKIEKYLLNSDFIEADENYISDSIMLLSKKYLSSKALKKIKTTDDIFVLCKNTIPFEKGNKFPLKVGTKCILWKGEKIGIVYNENYLFNYDIVKMIIKALPYYDTKTFVIENERKEPILKFFVKNEFAGCLMCMKKDMM